MGGSHGAKGQGSRGKGLWVPQRLGSNGRTPPFPLSPPQGHELKSTLGWTMVGMRMRMMVVVKGPDTPQLPNPMWGAPSDREGDTQHGPMAPKQWGGTWGVPPKALGHVHDVQEGHKL